MKLPQVKKMILTAVFTDIKGNRTLVTASRVIRRVWLWGGLGCLDVIEPNRGILDGREKTGIPDLNFLNQLIYLGGKGMINQECPKLWVKTLIEIEAQFPIVTRKVTGMVIKMFYITGQ